MVILLIPSRRWMKQRKIVWSNSSYCLLSFFIVKSLSALWANQSTNATWFFLFCFCFYSSSLGPAHQTQHTLKSVWIFNVWKWPRTTEFWNLKTPPHLCLRHLTNNQWLKWSKVYNWQSNLKKARKSKIKHRLKKMNYIYIYTPT